MADAKNQLIDQIFEMVSDTLVGKQIDKDKLQTVTEEIERVTGSKLNTYEDIQKMYADNAMKELRELQDAERKKRIEYLIQNCEISPTWEFENMDLSFSPEYRAIVEYCKKWCETFEIQEKGFKDQESGNVYTGGSLIWIYGDYGIGKSMLAGSIAHRIMRTYLVDFMFMQFDSINNRLQSLSGFDSSQEYQEFCQQLQTNRLLVIDVLGMKRSSVELVFLNELKDGRMEPCRSQSHIVFFQCLAYVCAGNGIKLEFTAKGSFPFSVGIDLYFRFLCRSVIGRGVAFSSIDDDVVVSPDFVGMIPVMEAFPVVFANDENELMLGVCLTECMECVDGVRWYGQVCFEIGGKELWFFCQS